MKSQNRGQSSQTPGDDRQGKLATAWKYIPVEQLRVGIIELVARFKTRGVAKMAGMAKDTIGKFVKGISQPNYSTRKKLGEVLLEYYPGGVMTEPKEEGEKEWKLRSRLIDLLPKGEANARAAVSLLFQFARAFPDEAPKNLAELERWFDLQVRGEYWAERHYSEIAREANAQEVDRARRQRQSRRAEKNERDGDDE
jgi:hypothetical protein